MDVPIQTMQEHLLNNVDHGIVCHFKDGFVHRLSGEELGGDKAFISLWDKEPDLSNQDNKPTCAISFTGGTDRLVSIGTQGTEELRFSVLIDLFIPISRAEAPFGELINKFDAAFKKIQMEDGDGYIYTDSEFPRNISKVPPSTQDPYRKVFITYRMYKRYSG